MALPNWILVVLKQLKKKSVKMRQQVKLMKQLHLKDKAEVAEKERECAHMRNWNDLASQKNSYIQRVIEMTLEMMDAEDEHDHVKVNELRQSLRELEAWNLNLCPEEEDWATLLTGTGRH